MQRRHGHSPTSPLRLVAAHVASALFHKESATYSMVQVALGRNLHVLRPGDGPPSQSNDSLGLAETTVALLRSSLDMHKHATSVESRASSAGILAAMRTLHGGVAEIVRDWLLIPCYCSQCGNRRPSRGRLVFSAEKITRSLRQCVFAFAEVTFCARQICAFPPFQICGVGHGRSN